jgi:outer membrane protein
MRQLILFTAVVGALVASAPAQAQFSNKTIGLSVGYMKMNTDNGYDHGIPVGLEATLYIENGFEFITHFDFMILHQPVVDQNVVGIAPTIGFHYLFMEEDVRPYVGLDLSYLHVFSDVAENVNFFGIGPNLGVDLMVSESVSLGIKVQYNQYLALNGPQENSILGEAVIKTYF